MIEFLTSVLKGIQWPLFSMALLGMFFKIKHKGWTSFDSLLVGAFVLFEFFAALQVWFFYGKLQTSSRYLLIGIIFYLPFSAYEIIELFKKLKKKHKYLVAGILLLFFYVIVNGYNIYSPIIKDHISSKQRRKRILTKRTAEVIRNDWNDKKTVPLKIFKCDIYQTGKQPLVESEFIQIGYLSGGQSYHEFMRYSNYRPDYIVSNTEKYQQGYRKIHTHRYKNEVFFIYKKQKEDF